MDRFEIKEAMNQVHISSEMQEEIIMNIQNQMENGRKRTWNWKKVAVTAAAFLLTAGVVSFPVRAFVMSVVQERMESLPKEEVQDMNDMMREQKTVADGYSREYSGEERERYHELWQEYEDGKFPENVIAQVDNAEDAPEGTLCYIRSTGIFNLPDHAMTDEEQLEIIDFQHKMSYTIEQSPTAQEARAEKQAEEDQWRERIQAAGGISEEEAIEIARKQMETELGERAEGKEVLKYRDGSAAVFKEDISGQTEYEHNGDVAYIINFYNSDDRSSYECMIDAVDGSVLKTSE